jgi:hypothetical protein
MDLMYPAAMDVERTMEFILKSQARAEARMERAEARVERAEARMEKVDRRIDAISKLVQQGMRMLVRNETRMDELIQAQKRTDVALAGLARRMDAGFAELTQTQKATEKSLKAFIDSLRHGRNGRNNR